MGLLTNHLKRNPHSLDPKVFLDRGRLLPDGPPLLKERRYLRKEAAEQLWQSLKTQGWKPLKEPAWGAAADV